MLTLEVRTLNTYTILILSTRQTLSELTNHAFKLFIAPIYSLLHFVGELVQIHAIKAMKDEVALEVLALRRYQDHNIDFVERSSRSCSRTALSRKSVF